MKELLEIILAWVIRMSEPNRFAYHRCAVCDRTWWYTGELHEIGCWVPRLRRLLDDIPDGEK